MRGLTPIFGSFNDAEFDEDRFERHLEADPRLAVAACLYWIRKLQALVFANDYPTALAAAAQAERLFWTSDTYFQLAEYHLYAALARAALCDRAFGGERARYLEALAAHHRQLQKWAANCPENFENRAALVAAEIARLEGREIDAERLYEQAIRSARANGFVHNEAIAYEFAARFYEKRGFEDFAQVYLRRARDGYLRWGADGKVRQLEEMYPHLRREQPATDRTSTIATPVEHLDLATVIKVSQAVSGEIVFEKLIDTLMRTAIEQAGAERGVLVLSSRDEARIAAEATTSGDAVVVELRDDPLTAVALPELVLHYVLRTNESVILDDAAARPPFAEDPYIRERQARSILCLPLISQAKLTGVLYLENNLARSVFAPARTAVLKLIASQAAISLKNTQLYRDLAEREARLVERTEELRRSEAYLAEAERLSHTGGWAVNRKGERRIIYWSEESYRIFGLDPLQGLPARDWFWQQVHPDDRSRLREETREALRQKRDYVVAFRLLLADGAIKHLESNGHHLFSSDGELVEVMGTFVDVTERKCAEEAIRESEDRLRQIAETVPGLLWSNGPDGEPTQINQRMLDYSGMRFEDFKLRGWEAFVHQADFPETARAFYHAIQTGTSYEGVMRLRRADGEFRWHHARCQPLRDREGRIIQWYGLSVDIDEKKKAEDLLRRSEARLAEAQRLTHIGVAAYNETATLYGSEETYRIWGFDPAQGVPSREAVFQRIHPDDLDRMQAEVQRALGERRRYSIEYRIVLPDGTVKHLVSIGEPEFSASGELVEVVATQIDVTERKCAEQALRESEAKFRDYAETASDWFWEIGPDHKFTLLTENAFGSNAPDRIGAACWDRALDLETEPEKWRLVRATLELTQAVPRLRISLDGRRRLSNVREG